MVRIFDAKGTLIYNLYIENQDRIEIKSAEFPAGIYVLQFNGNSNGSVVFVKE
ncbi:MAG: T9SS type A sorting domain-containing protein [Bacteroidales bacterium]|nr:T9SS type A sorting domain-containing protein [Bacteroidales bacterium]